MHAHRECASADPTDLSQWEFVLSVSEAGALAGHGR